MPLSKSLDEEGLVIAPVALVDNDVIDETVLGGWLEHLRNPPVARGDFSAQIAANRIGLKRLAALIGEGEAADVAAFEARLGEYNDYARKLAASALRELPDGVYEFTDVLDDDGQGNRDLAIACRIDIEQGRIGIDFTGSADETAGNVNCPLSVTAAGALYVFRCLMPAQVPACAGAFEDIQISAPEGSLLNARHPRAVAAGNVETSQRVVDAVLGALAEAVGDRIPAASHGSMNNVALGSHHSDKPWDYYETMGGGLGAGPNRDGASGVQAHMTNTLNTPVEVLERHFPLRMRRYALRRDSGGAGAQRGGDGLVREIEFLDEASYTLLTERRRNVPWARAGGEPGQAGENRLDGEALAPKCTGIARGGQRLSIASAGGGGYGKR
jgi:N-methylhydantoinase B